MAHLHNVQNNRAQFVLDPISHRLTEAGAQPTVLLQNDHHSKIITFEIPRYIDGHDMTLCSKAEIHYQNISATDNRKICEDVYLIESLQAAEGAEDSMILAWLVSGNATKYAGYLKFLIRFVCLTGTTVEYDWHTELYSGIKVLQGLSCGEAAIEHYSDLLETWKQEFDISVENEALYIGFASVQNETLMI